MNKLQLWVTTAIALATLQAQAAFIVLDDSDRDTITVTAGDFESGFSVNGILLTAGLGQSGSVTLPDGALHTFAGNWIDLGQSSGTPVNLAFGLPGAPADITSSLTFTPINGRISGSFGGFSGSSYGTNTLPTVAQDGHTESTGAPFLSISFRSETPLPTVSIEATDALGNEAGPDPIAFTLILDRPAPAGGIQLAYSLAGTASAGADYTPPGGALTIPEGQSSGTIPILPLADGETEGTETVSLTTVPGAGYSVGPGATAEAAIIDFRAETPLPAVSVEATDALGMEAGQDPITFTLILDRPAPAGGIQLAYSLAGTATAGADYGAPTGTLTIPEGQSSGTIPILLLADREIEGPETVSLTVVPGAGYGVGPGTTAEATIIDFRADTPLPVVSIETTDALGTEAGLSPITFTLALDRPAPAGGLDLAYTVAGTATAGTDYRTPSGTLEIPEGQFSGSVLILPLADTETEGPETVLLTVAPGTRHTVGTPATAVASIIDAPPAITVSLELADGDAAEKGPNDGSFRVVLSAPAPAGGLVVPYYLGGTATNQGQDWDYRVPAETLQVPAGATSLDLPINVRADRLREGTESVVVSLRPAAGYRLGAAISAQLGIQDAVARPPSSSHCQALQLSSGSDLIGRLAICQRENFHGDNAASYEICKSAAKTAFSEAFDRLVQTTEGCGQSLAGSEIAESWGRALGLALDPAIARWNIPPNTALQSEAARRRRFVTVSKVVERYLKALIRAEFRAISSGNRQARQALRQVSKTVLLRRIQNLRTGRPDYNGPKGPEFARLAQQAVSAISNQLLNPDEPAALKVAVGDGFGCVLLNNLNVKCWGGNDSGQLGLGDLAARGDNPDEMGDKLASVPLGLGRRVQDIAVGDRHACALLTGGAVKCWGANTDGQLGLGDTDPRGDQSTDMGDQLPEIDLGSGRQARSIHAGGAQTCARLDDATVKCWGRNQEGQLGLENTNARGDQPVEMGDALPAVNLGTGRDPIDLSLSATHTCARFADGSVKCWGQNASGGLGLGDTRDRGRLPGDLGDALPAVPLADSASLISVGNGFSCAVLDDGSVQCWGRNDTGQLGLGDTVSRGTQPDHLGTNLPRVDLGAGRKAEDLRAGPGHVCVRLDDDSIKCWGLNAAGALGLGDTEIRGNRPAQMGDGLPAVNLGGFGPVMDLALGGQTTCARAENGAPRCWGSNASGVLGRGDIENRGDQPVELGDALLTLDFGGTSAAAGRVFGSARE